LETTQSSLITLSCIVKVSRDVIYEDKVAQNFFFQVYQLHPFATAARRSVRVLVSVPFWGLQLSLPLPVKGLVSRYLNQLPDRPQSNH